MEYKKVSSREFQHNISKYITLSKVTPILLTKHGESEAMIVNPKHYTKQNNTNTKNNIMNSDFIGMHSVEYKNKPSTQISKNLREKAWYGK